MPIEQNEMEELAPRKRALHGAKKRGENAAKSQAKGDKRATYQRAGLNRNARSSTAREQRGEKRLESSQKIRAAPGKIGMQNRQIGLTR